MENNAEKTPDYKLLKLLDRVIVLLMVAILLVLTLPVMQAANGYKAAQAESQTEALPFQQRAVPDRVLFS